ncbi:hypothetical protein HKX48_001565 [Thoreauomyces humboldtii]|nr:hypothetical protein HKX48_001565 [Thoreauomyces humboldtii]
MKISLALFAAVALSTAVSAATVAETLPAGSTWVVGPDGNSEIQTSNEARVFPVPGGTWVFIASSPSPTELERRRVASPKTAGAAEAEVNVESRKFGGRILSVALPILKGVTAKEN